MFRRANLLVCGLIVFILTVPSLLAAEVRGEFTGVQSLATLQQITWSNVEAAYFHTDGHWIVRTSTQTTSSRVFPAAFVTAFANGGVVAALGQNEGWVVVDENNNVQSGNLHLEFEGNILLSQINNYLATGTVDSISFDPDGQGFAVVGNGNAFLRYIPTKLVDARNYAISSGREIQHIALGPDYSWAIIADNWVASRSVDDFHDIARGAMGDGLVERVGLNDQGGFALWLTPGGVNSLPQDSILNRFESGFGSGQANFSDYMVTNGIVGMSVSVLSHGEVLESRGYGRLSQNTDQYVDDETRFQLASISKAVTGLTVMRAMFLYPSSFPNGLDTTISEIGHPVVDQWRSGLSVDYSNTTTIRHLMSHTAGFAGESSGSHVFGSTPDPETMLLGLDGWARPPGVRSEYSGRGTKLLQLLLEEAVPGSETFQEIVERILLERIGAGVSDFDPYSDWSTDGNIAWTHCGPSTPIGRCDGDVFNLQNIPLLNWAATAGFVSSTQEAGRLLSVFRNGITPPGSPTNSRLISSSVLSEAVTPQKLSDGQEVQSGIGVGLPYAENPACRFSDGTAKIINHGGKGTNSRAQFLHNRVTQETIVFAFVGTASVATGTPDFTDVRQTLVNRLKGAMGHSSWTDCALSATATRNIPMIPIVGRFEGGTAQVGIWQKGYVHWTNQNLDYVGTKKVADGIDYPNVVKTGDVNCDGKDEILTAVTGSFRAHSFLPNVVLERSYSTQFTKSADMSMKVLPIMNSDDPNCANVLYYRTNMPLWLGFPISFYRLAADQPVSPIAGFNRFWHFSEGNWSIHDGTEILYTYPVVWGVSSEFVPFDWNLLFKPSTRTWYYRTSLSGGTTWSKNYGIQHDIPLHGVFNRGGVSRNSMVAFRPRDRKFFFFEIGGTATYHTVTFPYTD